MNSQSPEDESDEGPSGGYYVNGSVPFLFGNNLSTQVLGTWATSHLPDLLELVVVLEEEGQVHEGHVHVAIAPKLLVFLDGVSPARKRVLVDLRQQGDTQMLAGPGCPAGGHQLGFKPVTASVASDPDQRDQRLKDGGRSPSHCSFLPGMGPNHSGAHCREGGYEGILAWNPLPPQTQERSQES